MISIDGSYGESGGQMVRTALALSALTGQPFEINNIRKGRCDSGLKAQHLSCVSSVAELCGAKVEGAELGSETIRFYPGKIKSRTLPVDIGTAGSITLLLQSLLLPALFGGKKTRLKLTGGTDVRWSQPADYFASVLIPQLRKYASIEFKLEARGFYPKGGGKVDVVIKPKFCLADFESFDGFLKKLRQESKKINLAERKKLVAVKGISFASADLEKGEVADRQAKAAKKQLANLGCPVQITAEYAPSLSTGSGIVLWAVFSAADDEVDEFNPVILGADALGEKSKRAEEVGIEAANSLLQEISSNACADQHLADQLIPFMALVGSSKIKTSAITQHCTTNIHVTEKFLGSCFEVDEKEKIISSRN